MNPPGTTAELLVSQFAPAVVLTLKQVSQVTGQAVGGGPDDGAHAGKLHGFFRGFDPDNHGEFAAQKQSGRFFFGCFDFIYLLWSTSR